MSPYLNSSNSASQVGVKTPCFCQPLELDICSWSRAARSSTQRDCVHWCHHLCLVLPVGVLIGSCHQVLVSHWSRTLVHSHLLIASRAPMCRVAILDALLLTSAKKHPTQFCFSSRLQWTSRFHVEAQLEFRTLLFVPRRAPVVLFESNQEPNSDFRQTTYLVCYFQQWTHQRAILMAHRSFRFQMVPMETCLTILYRVHRYLLKCAFTVCLMRHTAVQTSAAEVLWRWRPHSSLQTCCYLSTDSRPPTVAGQVRNGRVCPRRHSRGGLRLHPFGDCIRIPLAVRQRSVF